MQLTKKLDINKYIEIKENAYSFAKVLDGNKLSEYVQKLNIEDYEERIIHLTTLLYPNDIEIIELVSEKCSLEQLCQKTNIPIKIIKLKAMEYAKYNLPKILKENPTLNLLCRQQSKFSNNEVTEEILNSKLK